MYDIRAIALDLDDTLWAVEPVIEAAEIRLFDWLSTHCPEIARTHTVASLRESRVQIARFEKGIAHDLTEVRRRSLHRVIVGEAAYPDAYVDRAMEEFLEHRNKVELFPDVLPFLERAREVYPLLSISNGNADLARIGLAEHFTAHVSARDVGAAKPDARVFLAACEHVGLRPHQVLHIGDHPVQDILGAAGAGMRTVWLNRDGTPWDAPEMEPVADHEVTSLEQVLNLLPLERPGDPE